LPDPSTTPHLTVQLRHRIGALHIDVAFHLTQPWTILFGPSGSGKTTILRAIAGILHPESAKIASHNLSASTTLTDTHARIFVPCHRRNIPLAAQRGSLFPHMTVRDQILYVFTTHPPTRRSIEDVLAIENVFTLFRISHVVDKLPAQLSSGEAQRVNLARAAAAASHLLLLDEPFTGLDLTLRSELMLDLQSWAAARNLCVLSVTHDIAEAFQLNAEVIKLSEGRIVAQGPAATVLAEDRARLLAQLTQPAETPASPAPAPA
jgi:molybdate transport system ATP-binding protein